MSLQELFQQAAQTITEVFDDVPKKVNYIYAGHGQTYDEQTEQYIDNEGSEVSNISMFFLSFTRKEIDDEIIMATDIKGLVASNYLPDGVNNGDVVELISTGKKYSTYILNTDPAAATYILRLRGL